jgi:serine/threonine protein kinase
MPTSINTRKQFRRNHFNKTVRRSKSLTTHKNMTSEEIGKGGFGIVSRPAAKCRTFFNKNFNHNVFRETYYDNPNYISKLTESSSAQRELEIALAIEKEIPFYRDYFCLVEFICGAPKIKSVIRNADYYDTYAISQYCGTPLDEYLRKDINAPINIFELCYLVTALQQLIKGLQILHLKHLYHKDIHTENILYDSDSGLMRFIDFGLAEDARSITNNNSPIIINNEYQDLDMLVKNVIIPLTTFLLQSRIKDSKIYKKYSYIKDFYNQLREFSYRAKLYLNPPRKSAFNFVNKEEKVTRLINLIEDFKSLKGLESFANKTHN